MAREFSKTNLAIWQDDEWRRLPFPAQHVYKMFWEHPSLSYCGVADWRPAKMLGWGAGWNRAAFDALTDCLRARHFLVVDEETEEVLVRSWIRFDGIIKQPRMAVSLAKAFAEVGSQAIRGVIVDELVKLRDRQPDALGWDKPALTELLDRERTAAKGLPVPIDPFADGFTISLGSVSGPASVPFGPNGSSNLGAVSDPPTTSTSTTTSTYLPASTDATDATSASEKEVNGFNDWWDTYDHKVGRKKAESAYRSALKKAGVTEDLLIAAAASYVAWVRSEGKHPQFTKHPSTWLNGEHWRDERTTPSTSVLPQPRALQAVADIEEPPDGLTPQEYDQWWRERRSRA